MIEDLVFEALKEFEAKNNIKLERDDTVYVWVWENSHGEMKARIDTLNHFPEGVATEVFTLVDIDNWWDHDWDTNPYDPDRYM